MFTGISFSPGAWHKQQNLMIFFKNRNSFSLIILLEVNILKDFLEFFDNWANTPRCLQENRNDFDPQQSGVTLSTKSVLRLLHNWFFRVFKCFTLDSSNSWKSEFVIFFILFYSWY